VREVCSRRVPQGCSKLCTREKICIRKVYLLCTCSKLCARSMRQECARSVQETVCRRKNLHTKSILAANLPQLVAAHLLQRSRYGFYRHLASKNQRDH
jgi:hypothetical protein